MVDKLCTSRILDALGLVELTPNTRRSSNGLFLKSQLEAGKAEQEVLATQLARLLLPAQIRVLPTWGVIGACFVSDFLNGTPIDRASKEHATSAATLLAQIHSVAVDGSEQSLIDAGFCHYWGQALRERLVQEAEIARAAFGESGDASELEAVARFAVEKWSFEDDVVIGHGDFQSANLIYSEGAVVAVDWTDFGLCERAYDLFHFIDSLDESVREAALTRYGETHPVSSEKELQKRGLIIDRVIRAGSVARVADDPPKMDQRELFSGYVAAATAAMEET